VLKRVRPPADWTAYRTGDPVGREAAILCAPELSAVWEMFQCPYLAFARSDGEVHLLMEDLTEYLLPDVDAPMARWQEDMLLDSLATLHARYWNADLSAVSWLATPTDRFSILGPAAPEEERRRGSTHPLFDRVAKGWQLALARVSPTVREFLLRPPEEIAGCFAHLPYTLVHGDAKVANFGFMPDRKLAAFDWSVTGIGVATLDIGYLVAVNASRLTRSKEAIFLTYRAKLEQQLGAALADIMWTEMVTAGIIGGSCMLLWAKGLGLDSEDSKARAEWDWWENELEKRVPCFLPLGYQV
jgi:hypothetical protein